MVISIYKDGKVTGNVIITREKKRLNKRKATEPSTRDDKNWC